MQIDLSACVTHGTIDNSTRDVVQLSLWLEGETEPLSLTLKGNTSQDLAGCVVKFRFLGDSEAPDEEMKFLLKMLAQSMDFYPGEMTFSRAAPSDEDHDILEKVIYLEFFADHHMRLTIARAKFSFDVSLPEWTMSWEEANAEEFVHRESLRQHIDFVTQKYKETFFLSEAAGFPRCEWDDKLNFVESRAFVYPMVKEKYSDCVNNMASMAYVLDLPEFLAKQAKRQDAQHPISFEDMGRDFVLSDFLNLDDYKLVEGAMNHPLFMTAAPLTQLLCEDLRQGFYELDIDMRDADAIIANYSSIISGILATILLMRDPKGTSFVNIVKRLTLIRTKIGEFMSRIPATIPARDKLLKAAHDLTSIISRFAEDKESTK